MNDAGKVAFTPKGVFDSAVTYEYLDTVQFGGNCYAARKTTTGNVPPTTGSYVDDNWAVLVVGGASVPIATIDVAGLVKSGNDGINRNRGQADVFWKDCKGSEHFDKSYQFGCHG